MRSELHDRWDKIAAPRNCEELVKLLSDHKEPAEMFFAAGARETNALRQLLDSQHMASHPGVFGGHKK